MRAFPLFLLVVGILASSWSARCEPSVRLGASRRIESFYGNGTTGPYKLSACFVEPGSDSLVVNDTLLVNGVDYRLDETSGTINFYRRILPSESVKIYYSAFPVDLKNVYSRRSAGMKRGEEWNEGTEKPVSEWTENDYGPQKLRLFGSKSVGVTVGGNGVSLDQSLHASIYGEVAEGWNVKAELTDQNVPFQPEGTTRDLEELDRIYIELASARFKAVFGDFPFERMAGDFFSVERRLEGVSCSFHDGNTSISGTGAVSPGKFSSMTFNGVEGVQGPYGLAGTDGETDITIVAGTEHVWVNGKSMVRGSDGDYTIDYDRAEITFTPGMMISSDSRIVVDFEYISGTFRKKMYSGNGGTGFGNGNIEFSADFFSEEDDSEHPVTGELNESDRKVLSAAGDDPDAAVRSGATAVPDSTGDYSLVLMEDDSVFVYTPGQGTWNVIFSKARGGDGDYSREYSSSGVVYYEYTGRGNGGYLPVVYLSLPELVRVADVKVKVGGDGPLYMEGETAFSIHDANTMSSLGSGSGEGDAAVMVGVGGSGDDLDGWNLDGYYRKIGGSFYFPGRSLSSQDDERWDEKGILSRKGVEEFQIDAGIGASGNASLGGEFYRIHHDDGTREIRYAANGELREKNTADGSLLVSASQVERRNLPSGSTLDPFFRKVSMSGSGAFFFLKPRFGFDHEKKVGSGAAGSNDYREYSTGLSGSFAGRGLEMDASLKLRNNFEGVGWKADRLSARSWTVKGVADFRAPGETSGHCRISHREKKDFLEGNSGNSVGSTDLAGIEISFLPMDHALRGNIDYEFTGMENSSYVFRYVPVNPDSGNGTYSYDEDLGTWFRDPEHGTYRRVEEESDVAGRVLQSVCQAGLVFRPAGRKDLPVLVRNGGFRIDVDLKERNERNSVMGTAFFQKNEGTIFLSRRVDARFDWTRSSVNPDYGFFGTVFNLFDADAEDGRREIGSNSLGGDAAWSPAGGIGYYLRLEREKEEDSGTGAAGSWSTKGWSMDASVTWTPDAAWRFKLAAELERKDVDYGDPDVMSRVALSPSIRFSAGSNRRMDIKTTHTWIGSRSGEVPLSLRGGKPEGFSHDIEISAVSGWGKHTGVSVEWHTRIEPGYPVFNELKADMTAYF